MNALLFICSRIDSITREEENIKIRIKKAVILLLFIIRHYLKNIVIMYNFYLLYQ